MRLLKTDRAGEAVMRLYSATGGRPATDPAVLLRSFVLMLHMGYTSVQKWVGAARADLALQYLIGTTDVPSVGCHYEFISRLTAHWAHLTDLYPARKNTREIKAQLRAEGKQPGKEEKWVNYDDGDVLALVEGRWDDDSVDAGRWTRPLEVLFDAVAVRESLRRYNHGRAPQTLSGDGSALHIHSSSLGRRVVEEAAEGEPTHRYTAPDADIGWDSHEDEFYLGFVFYNVTWHLRDLGLDLPVFVAQRCASQHDSLTAVTALAQMLDVDPGLLPTYFCHDSATDAAHFFRWLRHRGIIPIIDWNPRHSGKDPFAEHAPKGGPRGDDDRPLERLNEHGVPVCACGIEMRRDGYDRTKMATKYRCPLAVGAIDECPFWGKCTKSPYGRVVKTYDKTNYKLFGPVPYKSELWKDIYKDRTSTERVNNRILNDYKVQHLTCRDGYKHYFFEVIAAINVHLDAWVRAA